MTSPSLIFQLEAQVATITLNRPEAGNTFDSRMAYEFSDACDRVNQDDLIRVAVLRGAGDTFCLGDDSDSSPGVADVVSAVAKPVIACINGDAISAGLELALACDIRIASVNARFGLTQLQYGLMPHHGGTQRLPRLVGRGKALELILTGAIFDSAEAARM
ncbi:MAG TPA: enoyl-CoA hydratase/isomerase family protein, partial [Dehalococcoidia bacterium]|nr:enoyl-CoA hydratase/isomerase family protein [Dehalococcoidia bacterium]